MKLHFQAADFNFLYGVHYAWNLVVFNLVMSYSLTTPVITIFGKSPSVHVTTVKLYSEVSLFQVCSEMQPPL